MVFTYDGSYKGFLSALWFCFERKLFEKDLHLEIRSSESEYGDSLFEAQESVIIDDKKVDETQKGLTELFGESHYGLFVHLFRSGGIDKETLMISYIRCVLKKGRTEVSNPANPVVLKALRTASGVRFEVHRYYGILRFEEQEDGILYAVIEPDNNIIDLLVPHFTSRFPLQKWVIHDTKRGLVVYWDTREAVITKEETGTRGYGKSEDTYTGLWKRYFKTAAIDERRNSKLQNHMLPKRYRKHMTEF